MAKGFPADPQWAEANDTKAVLQNAARSVIQGKKSVDQALGDAEQGTRVDPQRPVGMADTTTVDPGRGRPLRRRTLLRNHPARRKWTSSPKVDPVPADPARPAGDRRAAALPAVPDRQDVLPEGRPAPDPRRTPAGERRPGQLPADPRRRRSSGRRCATRSLFAVVAVALTLIVGTLVGLLLNQLGKADVHVRRRAACCRLGDAAGHRGRHLRLAVRHRPAAWSTGR